MTKQNNVTSEREKKNLHHHVDLSSPKRIYVYIQKEKRKKNDGVVHSFIHRPNSAGQMFDVHVDFQLVSQLLIVIVCVRKRVHFFPFVFK